MTAPIATRSAGESGFTLIEVMVTTLILTTVSAVVISGVLNMTQLNGTVTNRTAMFAGVRNATALLEQEVGQAGRVALPAPVSLSAAVAAGLNTVTVSSTAGMFVGERLVIGAGTPSETVTLTGVGADSITATFLNNHVANEPVIGVTAPLTADGRPSTMIGQPLAGCPTAPLYSLRMPVEVML